MQIVTGRQIKAARALVGLDQPELAKLAGLHRNAVGYWECRDTIPRNEPVGVRRIREALILAGATFSSSPPGVSFMPCAAPNSEMPSVRGAQIQDASNAREAAQ